MELVFSTLSPLLVGTAFIIYASCLVIWRLYLDPLANFPGSKIAAATSWYEFWYDVIGQGQFIWVTKRMHQEYGPIVRVNPYELHINDPEFYDQIYAGSHKRRNKYDRFVAGFDAPGAMATTVDHDVHRHRRDALASFFSKRSVLALEPAITEKVERLCQRIDEFAWSQQVLNLSDAYVALTMDVISDYCFGRSYRYLETSDFRPRWRKAMMGIMRGTKTISAFPWIPRLVKSLPERMLQLIPSIRHLLITQRKTRSYVNKILMSEKTQRPQHQTIFHALRDDTKLPPAEKNVKRLMDEGQLLIGAGSDTTAKTLAIISYHLLADQEMLQIVRKEIIELEGSNQGQIGLTQLEQLPYFGAVVKEGLRLNHGFTARTPRIATHDTLQYGEYQIPPGIPVSMSSVFMHLNEDLFPEPHSFKPERWLEEREDGRRLDRYLVAFGRGSRKCIGYDLAYAEMYLALASILLRFDMELFETDITDVAIERDWAILQPKLDSEGVRVKVNPRIHPTRTSMQECDATE